jgi:adenosylcobyric acid synthase
MIQGTNSNAGKSVLVAGLCRAFANRGLLVQPFKPQNMSNNAAAVPGGGEIGRAQAVQALAARVPLSVHHNPVLLKPESDRRSQIVVLGQAVGTLEAERFTSDRSSLLQPVLDSFATLQASTDLVIVEGAGSPAETNLRTGDIANMGFALAADVPVVLAGDIDRGGVIASLVGTQTVLDAADRSMIRGYLINKFRGDVGLFDAGLTDISTRTGWPSFGVVTWSRDLAALPAEDAVELGERRTSASDIHIAVPMLSRIANFDDVDPLGMEPDVTVTMVPPGQPLPDADVVLIPGTKATVADLQFFRQQGWDADLATHVRRGGTVVGLCGGYQMLGSSVADPEGVEGPAETVPGLGLLDVNTVLHPDKVTRPVTGTHNPSGLPISGYEIHVGRTNGPDADRPWLTVGGNPSGAMSANGRIAGSYVHGVFSNDDLRSAFLANLRPNREASGVRYDERVDEALDNWANQLEDELDLEAMLRIASESPKN